MDEANRSVVSYFLPSYTSSSCWTCGNPCHSMEKFLEKKEYKRKQIDHYQSHLGYEPSSNTFDSYPCSTSRYEYDSMCCGEYEYMEYNNSNYFYQPQEPSHQQPYHDQGQNIEPLLIPVTSQVGEDVVDSNTTYHTTISQELIFSSIMDTKLLDHEDFFVFSKEEEECLDSLEELVSYIEQDFEITYFGRRARKKRKKPCWAFDVKSTSQKQI
ncbi:hypothetical protein Tco_1154907 [Tanacetum coccineum]